MRVMKVMIELQYLPWVKEMEQQVHSNFKTHC